MLLPNWRFFLSFVVLFISLAYGCKKSEPTKAANGSNEGTPTVKSEPDFDLSTPKATAYTYYTAMQRGDTEAAKAASVGTTEQLKVFEALPDLRAAYQKYKSAAVAKFGEAGKNSIDIPDIYAVDEVPDFRILGNIAIGKNESAHSDEQVLPNHRMKLVMRDGQWKVDLSSFDEGTIDKMRFGSKRVTTALSEAASEISAGKYETAMDALQAADAKMRR